LSKEGIEFKMVDKEEFLNLSEELKSSLVQAKKIQKEELFELSNDHKEAIDIGRNQIKNGQIQTHSKVISEMRIWLEGK
jgi:hypothetical protein